MCPDFAGSYIDQLAVRYKALLFDLDGTLVQTDSLHRRAYDAALRPYGLSLTSSSYRRHGNDGRRAVAALLKKWRRESAFEDIHASKTREFLTLLSARAPRKLPASQILEHSARSIPAAIVTSASKASATVILERMGWLPLVAVIVTGDDVEERKPSPRPYETVLDRLGLAASDCLAFEDSIAGLEAATAAALDAVDVRESGFIRKFRRVASRRCGP